MDVNCPDGTGECDATPTTELIVGQGKWRVPGFNANGTGPWSSGLAFDFMQGVPGTPVPVSPIDTTETTANPTYSRQALAGATWYNLNITAPGGGQYNKWYSAGGQLPRWNRQLFSDTQQPVD